ncbi:MAG: polyketide synthase dehydratase domain-containing protein, partial [Chloroflexi bacterium]|nr:polyketide synthase dehydratase domain-containing protein [Chloroflexota bacterium]
MVERTAPELIDRMRRALNEAGTQLEQYKRKATEPIAVIGMACRFPGAETPEEFWTLLANGEDRVRPVPPARWSVEQSYDPVPGTPGKSYQRDAALLAEVDRFDPAFFGISPREAQRMDPQHRLLLEVSWEALERAGQAPAMLQGSRTGVFTGISASDYLRLMGELERSEAHVTFGNSVIFGVGRLSYVLGLQGPSLVIDTACSASLIGVHLACESLRARSSDLALAGGVHLLLSEQGGITLSQMLALSPDGRSKPFDASANGFGRGEGCGMVVLKRLSDAQADGDPILALIRGSATNHDGPSSGLTVPSATAQAALIRQALTAGKVTAHEVAYVEAHGTGTVLGDPIEVRALDSVFERREGPLWVGSVKSNIGHLEEAAGIAGLIKVILSMQHGELPSSLHFRQPNPYIDWEKSAVRVVAEKRVWPVGRKIAGISSFGLGGSNAHVVVEEAPAALHGQPEPDQPAERPLQLLTLSARDDAALAAYIRSYSDFLATHSDLDLGDLTYTSHVGRSHFSHRVSVVAGSVAELGEKLVAAGTGEKGIQRGVVAAQQETPQIAFLFTGQGAQYSGMGRELYETQPVFRAILDRCDQAFQACYGRSLVDLLYPTPDTETASSQTHDLMNSHPCGQAANYALECALAELWRGWGITPDAVLGHSLGDFAAAYVAGVLGLEDGLRLVTRRGQLMERTEGEMVAVMASARAVAPFVEPYPDATIGVVNGPLSVVVSGARVSVAAITQALQGAGFKTRRLAIPVAAHSPMLDPVLDEFEEAVRATPLAAPRLPVVSSMTGMWVTEELTQPSYWRAHLRNTVQFAQGVATLHAAGTDIFLEVGPQATLLGMAGGDSGQWSVASGQEAVGNSDQGTGGTAFLPSLRPGQSDWQQLLSSLGELYVRGSTIDWEGFDRGYSRRKVALPTYPFQRQRYWVQSRPSRRAAASLRPLIDQMTPLPALQTVLFETEFSVETLPFLADHRVYGEVVSPGAGQIALALHAAQLCLGEGTALKLEDVILPQPLVLSEGQSRSVQALFKAEQAAHTFQLVSLLPASSETAALPEKTATHASGRAVPWTPPTEPSASLAALQRRCSRPMDLPSFYTGLEAAQIAHGPSFRWLGAAWRSASTAPELLVRLVQPPAVESLQGYLLHPGLLDGCFQAAVLLSASGGTLLPFALESVAVQRAATAGEWWCHVVQRAPDRYDLVLLDAAGSTVAQITGFQMRVASAAAIRGRAAWQEWLYTVDWQQRPYFGLTPEFLPLPDQQAAAWRSHALAQVSDAERSRDAALHAALEEVSLVSVLAALCKAGVQLVPGALWRSEHVASKLSLLPTYRRLLERLLEMLVEAAILQPVPAGWQVLRTPETTEPAELLAALQMEHGERPELRLLGRCAAHLHDVLRGAQEPLELIFPGGDATEAAQLYSDTPTARMLNGLVQAVVSSACAHLPAGRGLRILEIGAGTGGTTAGLLPLLPADRVEYIFTDIGPTFLNKAQERFSAFPFVHYQPLNIEQEPVSQGFQPYQADLVVAANVLHATRDLGQTLAHVRQLLQPGGQLVLLEATERRRWLDLTFGLTDGWWRYADERQGHPLLSAEGWRQQLSAHGFVDVAVLEQAGQAVIVAQADSLPSRLPEQSWLILADRQGVGAALASQLRQQGDLVQLVYAAHSAPPPEGALSLEPSAPAQEWQQLLASSWQPAGRTGTARLPRLHGVVHLWSLDTPALPAALRQRADLDEKTPLDLVAAAEPAVASALQLAQALLQAQVEPTGFWLVTRDSQPVGPAEPLSGVLQSALWGLGKVIVLEHPELQPRCIDLSQDEDVQTQATRLRAELLHPGEERQIALRPDARYVARLQRYGEQGSAQELALPA